MAEETELQEPKEYKVLVNATNGLFPADNGSLHLSKEQAKYIGVNQKGPFKPEYYRY